MFDPLTQSVMHEDVRAAIDRGEWKLTGFFCKKCGESGYSETKDPFRWGCRKCGYTTYNPKLHFTNKKVEVAA